MRPGLFLIAACFVLLSPCAAQAQICWGSTERVVHVRKLPINSPENKPLNLARLLRMECLGLPYMVADAGYVLAVEGEERFFPLSERQIASFQSSRALPRPLPAYEMSMMDWAIGHSLWIAASFALLFLLVSLRLILGRRRGGTPPPKPRQARSATRPAKR